LGGSGIGGDGLTTGPGTPFILGRYATAGVRHTGSGGGGGSSPSLSPLGAGGDGIVIVKITG
jgi:hypothetical protein